MGETSGSSTHDLLLALAGQVDDDLLAWARELVAVGENTRAIALVTAGVTADRTALPAPLRAELVAAARAARTDLDADAALPEAADVALDHRFAAAPAGGDDRVADVVGALPARLLDGAEVQLAWRLTPAGSAPGPLPHPVVLVEVGPGGRPADVLAYQLSVALDRSGVVASVEVLTSGNPLPAYHAAARRAASRIHEPEPGTSSMAAPPAAVEVAEPAEPLPEPGYADLWAAQGPFAVAAEPSEPDATATDPTGGVVGASTPPPRPVPLRPARDAAEPDAPRPQRRRTTVTPLTRSVLPSPVPLARRDGSRLRPLVPVTDEAPEDTAVDEAGVEATDPRRPALPDGGDAYSSFELGQVPALADTPMFRSMQDPLSGPLNAPLLAPLLDPTPFDGHDGPVENLDEDLDPFGLHGISPLAPDRPAPARAEDRWASEWTSGDWAVSSSDLSDRSEPSAPDPGHDAVPDPGRDSSHDSSRDSGHDEDEAPRHRADSGPAEEAPVLSRFTPQARSAPAEPPPGAVRSSTVRPSAAQPSATRPFAPETSSGRPFGAEASAGGSAAVQSPTDQFSAAPSPAGRPSGTPSSETPSSGAQSPSDQFPPDQFPPDQFPPDQSSGAQPPTAQRPEAELPVVQSPAAQAPGAQAPSAPPSAAPSSAARAPADQSPADNSSTVQSSTAQLPAAQSSAAQSSAAQSTAAQSSASRSSTPRSTTPQPPPAQPPLAAPRPTLAQPAPGTPSQRPEPPSVRPPARPAAAQEPARAEQGPDGLGLRPDSVARLSDADRELLARLQAELGTGTRPRTSRRAGVAPPNGTPPATNGNGRHDPPDLAG